jgi:hypothetical protein
MASKRSNKAVLIRLAKMFSWLPGKTCQACHKDASKKCVR